MVANSYVQMITEKHSRDASCDSTLVVTLMVYFVFIFELALAFCTHQITRNSSNRVWGTVPALAEGLAPGEM